MCSSAPNSAPWSERAQVHTNISLLHVLQAPCLHYCHSFPVTASPGHNSLSRPKSLLVSSPSTKLLSLEEAQARTQAQINSPVTEDSKYIEVGEGPAALQGKFHTVIEFPTERFVMSVLHETVIIWNEVIKNLYSVSLCWKLFEYLTPTFPSV